MLAILDRIDDPAGRANAVDGLGGVEQRSGAFEKALGTALHALSLYVERDDDAGTASTYNLLGRASLALGSLEEADRYHGPAHALYVRSGNSYGPTSRTAGPSSHWPRGEVDRAALLLREAAGAHFTVGNRHHAAQSCRKLITPSGAPVPAALGRVIVLLEADRVPTAGEFTLLLDEVFG